jgi:RNA polymerase sigma factor (sigma-70 family)
MTNGQLAHGPPGNAELTTRRPALQQTDRELLEKFIQRQDGEAFAALVERHGSMVLGVCQRVLDHAQDAEDAFQATFMVLVRKARSLGQPELLGNWLYGVAYRTSCKARTRAARRRLRERQAAPMPTGDPVDALAWREIRTVLDDELQRLPARYRAPLVLCYLEGLTNEEAARRLGCPTGSISYRLARGRELLRHRLEGRHQALPAGSFALMLVRNTGPAALPGSLVDATVRAGVGLANNPAGAGLSASVSDLLRQTLQALSQRRKLNNLLVLLAILLFAGLVSAAVTGLVPLGNVVGGSDNPASNPGNGSGISLDPGPCH